MTIRYWLLAICLCVWLSLFIKADEDIARQFLAKGDEALKKGKAAQALEFYQKAAKEGPNLPEAHFKTGQAYLELNEKVKGRIAFKKCLALIDKIDKPTPALKELRKKAEQSVNELQISCKEGKIIERDYLNELLAFAKRCKIKDTLLAEDALKRVLEFDPNNVEAQKLLEEIKKDTVFPRWEVIFKSNLDGWKPQEPSNWWVEEDKIMVCDTQGAPINIKEKVWVEGNFKVSMEFKIAKSYRDGYAVGIVIGMEKEDDVKTVAVLEEETLKLIKFTSGKGRDLHTGQLPDTYKKGDWNRLQVEVLGENLRAYVNDKLSLEYKADDKSVFKGKIGIWVQRCQAGFADIKYLK